MTSDIRVWRSLFFRRPRAPTQRFVEHAPPERECDHPVCNCTVNVAERPTGEPSAMGNRLVLDHAPIGALRPEFDLSANSLCFMMSERRRFRTDPQPVTRDTEDDYARFDWTRLGPHGTHNNGLRSVSIGIPLPGYGLIGWFRAHLYMGNRIDVSRLRNGWLPSKIVDLSKLGENDLWVHDCASGHEAMRVISASAEAEMWRTLILDAEEIDRRMSKYTDDFTSSVEELRARVMADADLVELASSIIRTTAPTVGTVRETELFRLASEVETTVLAMSKAS